jgi:intracellular multiplication protein IcmT
MVATFSKTAAWRDSARAARFLFVDARAAFPVFVFLMHICKSTGFFVIVSVIFFSILERYGFTVPVFLRWLRLVCAGDIKTSKPWWQQS